MPYYTYIVFYSPYFVKFLLFYNSTITFHSREVIDFHELIYIAYFSIPRMYKRFCISLSESEKLLMSEPANFPASAVVID